MKELVGALLGLLVSSNIWLWLNLWNLKNEHFRLAEAVAHRSAEFPKQPAEYSSSPECQKPHATQAGTHSPSGKTRRMDIAALVVSFTALLISVLRLLLQ